MRRKHALIWLIATTFLVGCSQEHSQKRGSRLSRSNTAAGIIERLEAENLPALEKVETWQNEYGPGLKITTAHYEVFTTLLEPLMLRQIPGFIESAYRSYNSQLAEPITTRAKFTVYLFATRKQWEDFTGTFTGKESRIYTKIKAGAYYLNGACVAYNIGREATFSVLGHEGWHQFNSRHFKYRLPSWLDEGVAMLFEASRYERGLFYFEAGRNMSRLAALRQTLMKNRMIPLRQLIAINPGEVLMRNEEAVMAFYSQSYALARFLREDGYGKRLMNYHRMLQDGLRGTWQLSEPIKRIAADRNIPLTVRWNRAVGVKLFEQYIGEDFEQIEEEYRTFCRKIVYHVRLK